MKSFHPYGEEALLINFEQDINETVHQQVIALKTAIEAAQLPGISFLIPAYCSLTVGYNPEELDYETLCLLIKNLETDETPTINNQTRKLTIPVCYEEEFGLDLKDLAADKQLSTQEIIELHTTTLFRVYMLGFLPGFTYMGKLPESLVCNRKTSPRLRVPALSVGLAGYQTGIYPSEAPGGWQIIGRTPIPIFDTRKEHPFLCQAGDQVQFEAISKKAFETISKEVEAGNFNWKQIAK